MAASTSLTSSFADSSAQRGVHAKHHDDIAKTFGDTYSVLVYNAVGDGVADDTAAVQATIDAAVAAGGGTVVFPAGTFRLSSAVTKSSNVPLAFVGSGMTATQVVQYGNADAFSITLTANALQVMIRDMTIVCAYTAPTTSGAAFRLSGHLNSPAFTAQNIVVGTSGSGEFTYGFHLTDSAGTSLHNVTVRGLGGTTGVYFTATLTTGASAPHKLVKCDIYNALYGVRVVNTTNLGVEGVQLVGCDIVGGTYGFHVTNSAGYYAPHFMMTGGHIEASDTCVHMDKVTQVMLHGVLLYSAGTGQLVRIIDSSYVNIVGNDLIVNTPGDPDGINISSPTGGVGSVMIAANNFALKSGGAKVAVKTSADAINTLRVVHNNLSGGAGFITLGYRAASIIVKDNYYGAYQAVASAATIAIPPNVDLALVSGTTTITSITAGWEGQRVTLVFVGIVTVTDGSNLKLAGNFVTTADDTLTLICDGTNWVEIARAVN